MSLGNLVVRLGLEAAEFTSGMSKSEADAKKFAARLKNDVETAGKAAGIALAAIGVAAGAAFVVMRREIENIAGFKQLSEQIGDTAEAIGGLQSIAATSGVSLETIAAASIKLTAGLSKTDDESKGAAAAIKALGINLDDFLKLSPVAQLEAIAKKLAEFEDGAGKTAFAVAAFGKAGAAALPFLNDLADAGGRQVKLTQEQIELADRYSKQQARMRSEIQSLIQLVAIESLPAFIAFTGALLDTTKAMFGVGTEAKKLTGNDVKGWAETTARVLGFVVDAADGVARVFQIAGASVAAFAAPKNSLADAKDVWRNYMKDVDAILMRPLFSDRLAARMALPAPAAAAARPVLDPRRFAAVTGTGAAKKDADEFGKALETVAKSTAIAQAELDALLAGTGDLTQAQKTLAGIMADKSWLENYTEQERALLKVRYEQFDAVLRNIDAEKKRREEFDKTLKSMHDQAEAETKVRDAVRATVADYTLQNDILARQIAIIGQEDIAHQKLAATVEYERLRKEALALTVPDLASLANLEREYQVRLKLIDAADLANKALDEQRKSKEFVEALGQSFASAAEDAIVFGKTAKDVLKGLEQDLLRIITRRLVTQPLEAGLNTFLTGMGVGNVGAGGTGAGANWGAMFANLAASFFGGSSAPMTAAGNSTFGYASGTNYARGGWSMVGERGPEAMYVPRGAQVIPNHELMARREAKTGPTIIINTTIEAGASRQTADQRNAEGIRQWQQAAANL